jgi:cytochrome c-type biogenesis protein CcmE
VQTNSSTSFVGAGCRNLQNGTAVAVQGVVQSDTTLLATQVTVQRES